MTEDQITIRREDLQAITRIDTKMSGMCDRMKSVEDAIVNQTKTCNGRLEHCVDHFENKGSNKLLQWAIGGLIVFMLAVGGVATVNKVGVNANTNAIETTRTVIEQLHPEHP